MFFSLHKKLLLLLKVAHGDVGLRL